MNFLACDREQPFLMPPDPRDWLPEDHLAWFVLASVEQMDLSAFFAAYRRDGWGRAAFEPSMMVSLLLYAYARGERSSRGIERKCVEDVAYRVITAQQKPDHATIARFRARHEDAPGRAVQLCAGAVQAGGPREGRGDRDRRNEGPCERLASLKPRLRAARQGDPQGGLRDRRGRGRALRRCAGR
jgi:transposase